MRKLPPEEAKARRRAASRAWQKANPEKRQKQNRDGARRWYWANRATALEANRARTQDWKKNNPARLLARGAERRAQEKKAAIGDRKAVAAIYQRARSSAPVPCFYCGQQTMRGDRHVDHVIPIARQGAHDAENLVVSCAKCNLSKGKKTSEEFMALRGRRT